MYRYRKYISSGITLDSEGTPVFDWNSDSDIIKLCTAPIGAYDNDGVRYVYGYKFNNSAKNQDKKVVRDFIKNSGFDENVEEFVDNAVIQFDSVYSLDNFAALVSIEPSTDGVVVQTMEEWLVDYMRKPPISFQLIKELYENVTFDYDKAYNALASIGYSKSRIEKELEFTMKKFDVLKQSNELFQIKRFIPKEIRSAFSEFLKFRNDEDRRLYEGLQGVEVLVFDDFLTSGSTINEVIRYLRSINESNLLTVFILIDQN